jgi:hypothetical protein
VPAERRIGSDARCVMERTNEDVISIPEAIEALPGPWQPADLTTVNDAIVRVVLLEGEFPWHAREACPEWAGWRVRTRREDELFLCWKACPEWAGVPGVDTKGQLPQRGRGPRSAPTPSSSRSPRRSSTACEARYEVRSRRYEQRSKTSAVRRTRIAAGFNPQRHSQDQNSCGFQPAEARRSQTAVSLLLAPPRAV